MSMLAAMLVGTLFTADIYEHGKGVCIEMSNENCIISIQDTFIVSSTIEPKAKEAQNFYINKEDHRKEIIKKERRSKTNNENSSTRHNSGVTANKYK